ncbi:hypothetical protein H3V53_10730 [Paraburkholderia bengalensis]|uniref:Uncharacterized protein n=1 Tax=Paraburkholderia bengalensis TaxID=2747562 RepID=A0ABU8IQ21_9BURK
MSVFIGVLGWSGERVFASVVKQLKISNIKHLSTVVKPSCQARLIKANKFRLRHRKNQWPTDELASPAAERLALVQHIGIFVTNLIGRSTVAHDREAIHRPDWARPLQMTPQTGQQLSAYCEAARRAFDRDGLLTFRQGFRFT